MISDSALNDFITSDKTVIVLFVKESCKSCGEVRPIVDSMGPPLLVVDLEDDEFFATKYSFTMVPTVIVFRDGKVKEHIEEPRTEEVYRDLIFR